MSSSFRLNADLGYLPKEPTVLTILTVLLQHHGLAADRDLVEPDDVPRAHPSPTLRRLLRGFRRNRHQPVRRK